MLPPRDANVNQMNLPIGTLNPAMAGTPLNATLIERRDLHEELIIVRVGHDSGAVPAFEPGQFCTPDDSAWSGLRGRVQSVINPDRFSQLTGAKLSSESCEVFLCGNPAMSNSVERALENWGFVTRRKKGNLHFERYW